MQADAIYRRALVTFVDILGFRELVTSKSASDVRKIVHAVQKFGTSIDIKPDVKVDDRFNWTRTFAFSDSIIRIRPFDSEFREGALFHEIIALVHMQAELADLGVFVRGGLTAGEVYFEENAIFGPAFIRAYQLEFQFANVPRIIVDPEVFHELRSNPQLRADHHELADEIYYLKRLLSQSDDGIWFVDYLLATRLELGDPDYYPVFLKHHRDFIVGNATGVPSRSRTLQKYLWLANYHNKVVTFVSKGDPPNDLLITRNEIAAFETMPEISADIRDD